MVRLLAAVALLASVSWASAQEDSTRVRHDSIRLQMGDMEPMMPMGSSVISPADHYGRTPQLGDRPMTMPPVRPRAGDIPPYYTNPSPMFRGDYSTGGVLGMGRKFVFTGSGSQTSIPGIGRLNNASVGYSYALNDKLSAFSRKLHLLYLSIRYYTLNDVWNNVTAGMLDRDNGEVARLAMNRWRRAAALVH